MSSFLWVGIEFFGFVLQGLPEMSAKNNLKEMLLEKSVRTGDFTLASGKKSDLYVDCRLTALDNRGASWIGEVGWGLKERIEGESLVVNAIGGMTMGADPISLVVGIASAGDEKALQIFNIRKEPKGHGRGKQIEGNFNGGDKVVVVDDVITTGGSTLKAIEAIRAAGGEVVFCLVLVDREEGGRAAIESEGVPVVSIFTRNELLG
ncbi:orotate phosphoribosyltransferase [Akkermansiaceae bacterium]|nr:orotate phosphoribosyltransferase [Akkermansiaceae bacterium]